MAAFQNTREHTETKVMVHLLSEIDRNPSFTQRGLAQDLGIALGLMNQYLKSCTAKGWIRASQISPRRISYFLTPEGFKEKSVMVKDYLARSLTFFRDAKQECEEIRQFCQTQGWTSVALVGQGDLADIVQLVFRGTAISTKVVGVDESLDSFDGVIITDVVNPQAVYDSLKNKINLKNIVTPSLLHISRSMT
jgi:hypothetical protein